MHYFNVFSAFWAYIKGFGLKFGPHDEYHIDYTSRFRSEDILNPSYTFIPAF